MQFPVPQFTDVEDKIVGGLTFKQFGVVFVAAVLIFAVYTVSKNIVSTIVAGVVLGLPAVILAFGKLNGRPIYNSFGNAMTFITGHNAYFFQKEAHHLAGDNQVVQISEAPAVITTEQTTLKIQQLNYLLHQQREQESGLIKRLNEEKNP